jgi:hypothetical protein
MVWGYYTGELDEQTPNSSFCPTCLSSDEISNIDDWLLARFNDSEHKGPNGDNGEFTSGQLGCVPDPVKQPTCRINRLPSLASDKYGFADAHYYERWTPQQLQAELSQGHPVIVGVYTYMDKMFGIGHWMVLVGMDGTTDNSSVWVNDPGRSGASADTNGRYRRYSFKQFRDAWLDEGKVVVIRSTAVRVTATLDGLPYEGSVQFTLSVPPSGSGVVSVFGQSVSNMNSKMPSGSYTLFNVGGGPPNSTLIGVSPCAGPLVTSCTASVADGHTLSFSLQFVSNPPSAILYDNGSPVVYMYGIYGNDWPINLSGALANSFTLLSAATITAFNASLDLQVTGDTLQTVQWLITRSPFGGATLASGTATVGQTNYYSPCGGCYERVTAQFSLPNVSLGAGTYWLQLQNAVTLNQHQVFWPATTSFLVSDGSVVGTGGQSQAWQYPTGYSPSPLWWSNAFSIQGY